MLWCVSPSEQPGPPRPGRAPRQCCLWPRCALCRGLLGGTAERHRHRGSGGGAWAVSPSQLTARPCCPANLNVRFEQAHVPPGTFAALVGGELQGRGAHKVPPGLLGAWCRGASGSHPTGQRCPRVPPARSQLRPLPPGGPSLDSRASGCKTKSPSKGASPGCLRSAAAGLPEGPGGRVPAGPCEEGLPWAWGQSCVALCGLSAAGAAGGFARAQWAGRRAQWAGRRAQWAGRQACCFPG